MNKNKINKGFTLIEILIVIGIIAILAAIVIVAINPAKQFAQARNTQREAGLNTILNAVGQNIADFRGVFTCASDTLPIPTASSSVTNGGGVAAGVKDLSCLQPTYIPAFPTDPTAASGVDTGYDISVTGIGRVLVCAPAGAETAIPGSGAICVKR